MVSFKTLLLLFVIALFSTLYSEEAQNEEVVAYESVHKAIEKCIKDGNSAIDELTTWINNNGTKTTARALAVSIFNNRRWSQKIVDLSYENIQLKKKIEQLTEKIEKMKNGIPK